MTNLFERIKQAITADMEELFQEKESGKSGNPVSKLNQFVKESETEVNKAAKLINRQRILKEEFYKEWKQTEQMAQKRKQQGEIATEAGAADLAEIALKEQHLYEERAKRLQSSYENTVHQLEELERKYEEMKIRVKDMHLKRLELMGKENVISMKNKMNKVLTESEFGRVAETFETIEHTYNRDERKENDRYEISVFDAKIQQLAKEINQETMTK